MQLSGATCKACSNRVVFQDEGVWCGRCKTVYHKTCKPVGQCAGCNQNYVEPSRFFVRSRFCPVCLMPNTGQSDTCSACRASTRWDTEDDYRQRKDEVRKGARRIITYGGLELMGAVLFTAATLLLIVFTHHLVWELPFIAVGLLADGLRRIWAGLAYLKFE